ncbi:hypothetical protein NC651_018786 [Populus alba x Populus x berolinensis]|nr:hypothetical protein NC651_018786 [Populus alba x Populus x berolinensis]
MLSAAILAMRYIHYFHCYHCHHHLLLLLLWSKPTQHQLKQKIQPVMMGCYVFKKLPLTDLQCH